MRACEILDSVKVLLLDSEEMAAYAINDLLDMTTDESLEG